MTFRDGRPCQHSHTHTGSRIHAAAAANTLLGSVPTPRRTACPLRLAPLATAKNRAHLPCLPGRTVPPHLPGLSARRSVLHGSAVTLRSLQDPDSHPSRRMSPSVTGRVSQAEEHPQAPTGWRGSTGVGGCAGLIRAASIYL